jgi:hypothetical protein
MVGGHCGSDRPGADGHFTTVATVPDSLTVSTAIPCRSTLCHCADYMLCVLYYTDANRNANTDNNAITDAPTTSIARAIIYSFNTLWNLH